MNVQIVKLVEEKEVEKVKQNKLIEKEADEVKDLMKRLAEEKVKQKKLIEKEADEVKDLIKRVGEKKGFRILQEIQKKQLSENDFAHQEAAYKHKEEGSEMIIDLVLEKPSFKRKLVEPETQMNKAGEELKFSQQKEELDEISEIAKKNHI